MRRTAEKEKESEEGRGERGADTHTNQQIDGYTNGQTVSRIDGH